MAISSSCAYWVPHEGAHKSKERTYVLRNSVTWSVKRSY